MSLPFPESLMYDTNSSYSTNTYECCDAKTLYLKLERRLAKLEEKVNIQQKLISEISDCKFNIELLEKQIAGIRNKIKQSTKLNT